MPLVQLSAGAVHYQDLGSGPPLLLLHANPGDSEDFAAVSALVTELQQKLQVRGMSFVPTRATRLKAEADLTREALKAFAERAKLIAESMGAMTRASKTDAATIAPTMIWSLRNNQAPAQ